MPVRSDLRIDDLRHGRRGPTKLMNVKIPAALNRAIDRVANDLGVAKTDVVIALLNEGLDRSSEVLRGWRPTPVSLPPPKRLCTHPECARPYLAKGLCAGHYQAARRHGHAPRR